MGTGYWNWELEVNLCDATEAQSGIYSWHKKIYSVLLCLLTHFLTFAVLLQTVGNDDLFAKLKPGLLLHGRIESPVFRGKHEKRIRS